LSLFRETIEEFKSPPIYECFKNSLKDILKTEKDFDDFKTTSWVVMDYFLSRIFANIFNVEDKTNVLDENVFEEVKDYFNKYYVTK
jgi:hypothetical protein